MQPKDDPLSQLRASALAMIGDNALVLGQRPASGPTPGHGAYELAMGPTMKNWVKERLQSSGADVRLDHTIDRMTNHEFTPAEIKALEDRSLTALELPDALRLGGIQEGPPVDMHPGQKAIIDRLMNRIGGDPLAGKARDAYGRALQTGQIRVR